MDYIITKSVQMMKEDVKALIQIVPYHEIYELSGLWTIWQRCLNGGGDREIERAMVPIQSCHIYKLSSVGYALWQPYQSHQYYGGEARKRIIWLICMTLLIMEEKRQKQGFAVCFCIHAGYMLSPNWQKTSNTLDTHLCECTVDTHL